MISVPFTVDNQTVRTEFLGNQLFTGLDGLRSEEVPRWGRMTPQQMVEHLLWAMEVSNGVATVECKVPPRLTERLRTFLHNDTPTSHDFMNPVLKQGLPALRYQGIPEAVAALRTQMDHFLQQRDEQDLRVHPVFAPLSHEQWSRAHFKHFHHHLLQFGLIG